MKVKDRVKLIGGDYTDCEDDPFWNGRYPDIIGMITDMPKTESRLITGHNIHVKWANGHSNAYNLSDLQLINSDITKNKLNSL